MARLRTAKPQAELSSHFIYMPIPAAAANPTVKRNHPIANETRYRQHNQEFINDDNSTIGAVGAPMDPVERPPGPRFAANFVAESKQRSGTRWMATADRK
jgi:hypothetical protein